MGWNSLSHDMPSVVTISEPSASTASTRQEATAFLSMMTVHEPHSPTPQPSLVRMSRSLSRRSSTSVSWGSTSNS